MDRLWSVFANRRTAALLALGFASGLPLALTGDTLQAWMKDAKLDLGTIGLFSLVGLPYTIKFLWAPLMDRFVPPLLGRRRGWLLITQVLLIGAILAMAMVGPGGSLRWLAVMALLVAFCSASQDIVTDAYRTDVLPEEERGAGAAVSVMGYRIAMITTGAGALALAGFGISWPVVYALMAGMLGIGIVASLLAPEPRQVVAPPPSLGDAVIHPLKEFLLRPDGWLVLTFVVLFKLPDVVAGSMSQLFMLDIGIPKPDIALIKQFLGVGITIAGALFGGGVVARLGLKRSLWLFGILQAVSNLGFWLLSLTGPSYTVMVGVIAVENFCAGLVTAGFAAFLMSQCDARYSATQFALLSSLMAITRVIAGAPGGFAAKEWGWSWFFLTSVLCGIPGMLLLPWIRIAKPANQQRAIEVVSVSPTAEAA